MMEPPGLYSHDGYGSDGIRKSGTVQLLRELAFAFAVQVVNVAVTVYQHRADRLATALGRLDNVRKLLNPAPNGICIGRSSKRNWSSTNDNLALQVGSQM